MTWLHCSIKDGSVVTCSTDEDFTEQNASKEMRRHFINVHIDMPIDTARVYKRPLFDRDGNLVSKRQWYVDLNAVVPEKDRGKITDREQEVPLITKSITAADVTKTKR